MWQSASFPPSIVHRLSSPVIARSEATRQSVSRLSSIVMKKGVLQNAITARHSEPARTPAWESALSSFFAEIADISASADTRKISAKRPLQNATVSLGRVLVLWGKNGLPQPLRGFLPREGTFRAQGAPLGMRVLQTRREAVGACYFAMTREGHFAARPLSVSRGEDDRRSSRKQGRGDPAAFPRSDGEAVLR